MFNYSKIFTFLIILFFLNGCQNGSFFKRSDVKDNPVSVDERVQKNLEEGKGIRFGKLGKGSGGTFDFASSNELWRATVETLDFVPLTNASYSGGIIITDWFYDDDEDNSIKITVKFLSNEIRADGIDVIVYQKICNKLNKCKVSRIESGLEKEIKLAILKQAAILEQNERVKNPDFKFLEID